MKNSGKDFTGTWSIPDDRAYEIKVVVEDANLLRESASVVINGGKSTTSSPTPSAFTAPVVPDEVKEPLPWMKIIIGVLILLLVIIAVLYILARAKQASKGFVGQVIIEIKDEDTEERTSPQYKKLDSFKGKVKLHQLLQLAPELAETESILLTPGSDSIILVNQSACLIEKSGRAFDASKGKEWKNNDRIKITLQKVNKSIWLDYIK
ncbi:hypothetical protein D3C73_798670 [compost metagenome]